MASRGTFSSEQNALYHLFKPKARCLPLNESNARAPFCLNVPFRYGDRQILLRYLKMHEGVAIGRRNLVKPFGIGPGAHCDLSLAEASPFVSTCSMPDETVR